MCRLIIDKINNNFEVDDHCHTPLQDRIKEIVVNPGHTHDLLTLDVLTYKEKHYVGTQEDLVRLTDLKMKFSRALLEKNQNEITV